MFLVYMPIMNYIKMEFYFIKELQNFLWMKELKKHARDCKRFDDNRYIEDVKNRLKPDI